MTGKIMPLRERDTSTVQAAADAFLSSPQGTGRPAGATLGTARPGDLEPQPRRRGRLAVLVRRQPAARPDLAGQRRTAPRAPQRHPRHPARRSTGR